MRLPTRPRAARSCLPSTLAPIRESRWPIRVSIHRERSKGPSVSHLESVPSDFFPLSRSRLVTPLLRFLPVCALGFPIRWGLRAEGPVRGIVRFDDDGRRLWEVEDTPELLSVEPGSGLLYLWDPEGLDPGVVSGRLGWTLDRRLLRIGGGKGAVG